MKLDVSPGLRTMVKGLVRGIARAVSEEGFGVQMMVRVVVPFRNHVVNIPNSNMVSFIGFARRANHLPGQCIHSTGQKWIFVYLSSV
jgi:hypothetical protein